MKSLFEIITGHIGESYVRSYAWAHCEEDAREMFAKIRNQDGKYTVVKVRKLFDDDGDEFITNASDDGFDADGIVTIRDFRRPGFITLPGSRMWTNTPPPVSLAEIHAKQPPPQLHLPPEQSPT